MPTYVYECKKCEKTFEVEQRIVEDALTDCSLCGAKGSLRRLIQPIAVMFKGGGFHINDYAAAPPKEESAPAPAPTPEPAPAPAATPAPAPTTAASE